VTIYANHSWNDPSDYEIKVKAKDINGSESQWSEPHLIHIIKGPFLEIQQINGGLFTVDVLIRNLGEIEALNVSWSIKLEGGIILLGRKTTGLISCIQPANEHLVKSIPIFGFGEVIVTAKAEIPKNADEKTNSGFVYIFYIKVNPGDG
ncbi:MAG: Zn-dependent exopeptidase M28, partial [Thermoplasmatales archaeon]